MPPIWGMEDRTQGRVVGEDRVQFTFNSEADLHSVLNRGPWFVNGWMVALDQWTPNPQEDYLKTIAFWIRVRGLPIHMLKKPVVESLLGPLGKVEKVELHAKNSNSVEYVRALVQVNTEEPLQFRRVARLKSGVTYPTELEYEKLLRICYGCKRLTHDQDRCSYQIAVKDGLARTEEMSEQEPSLRKKLREKETKAKESLKKTSMKGVIIRNPQPSGSRSASKDNDARMAEKRKGKRVVTTPQRIWKPKSGGIGTQKTRSTEESIVDTRSSEGYSGAKSGSVGAGSKEKSIANNASDLVFSRLGGFEDDWGAKGSRGKRANQVTSEDLRVRLSGASSGEKNDGKSSKGSRSPPSVFERLGRQSLFTSGAVTEVEGSQPSKRRRQDNSDERNPKKARRSSSQKEKISPSVFQRLGCLAMETDNTSGGEASQSARGVGVSQHHSALVAAHTPIHFVRRIALESGSLLKEGLMGNTNPLRSI